MRGRLAALAVLLSAFAAWPAEAAIRLSFYSHGWGLGGAFLYFPHAFVVIERDPTDPPGPARESYGFTAASPNSVMLTGRSVGRITEQDRRYESVSRRHFTLVVTQEQYLQAVATIEGWRAAEGNRYSLRGRNCISFVAAIARSVGLDTPETRILDPSRFLEGVRAANAERLAGDYPHPIIEPPGPQP